MNRPDSTSKTMPKNAELKLPSCELQKKLRLRNCGVAVAEQHVFKKLRNCDCGSASFKLRNCNCGLKKKLRVPTSENNCLGKFNLVSQSQQRCKSPSGPKVKQLKIYKKGFMSPALAFLVPASVLLKTYSALWFATRKKQFVRSPINLLCRYLILVRQQCSVSFKGEDNLVIFTRFSDMSTASARRACPRNKFSRAASNKLPERLIARNLVLCGVMRFGAIFEFENICNFEAVFENNYSNE